MRNILFIIISFLLIACFNQKGQENNESSENSHQRVFATMPALTALLELLYPQGMIGLNYKPYPEDKEFMPTEASNLPVLGLKDRINYEAVVALKPDIIIFPKPLDKAMSEPYEKLGIKILKASVEFKDIEESIRLYDEHLNIKERADKLLAFYYKTKSLLDELRTKMSKKPRIYFAFGIEGLQTVCASKAHQDDDLALQIGGENVIKCEEFDYYQRLVPMNFEQIIAFNPEVVFVREIALYKELINNPSKTWQRIDAIKNKRVYYAPSSPSNWLHRPPSVMRIIGYPWAFSQIHPELLSEDELKSIVKEFFAEFLRPISDEEYKRLESK